MDADRGNEQILTPVSKRGGRSHGQNLPSAASWEGTAHAWLHVKHTVLSAKEAQKAVAVPPNVAPRVWSKANRLHSPLITDSRRLYDHHSNLTSRANGRRPHSRQKGFLFCHRGTSGASRQSSALLWLVVEARQGGSDLQYTLRPAGQRAEGRLFLALLSYETSRSTDEEPLPSPILGKAERPIPTEARRTPLADSFEAASMGRIPETRAPVGLDQR